MADVNDSKAERIKQRNKKEIESRLSRLSSKMVATTRNKDAIRSNEIDLKRLLALRGNIVSHMGNPGTSGAVRALLETQLATITGEIDQLETVLKDLKEEADVEPSRRDSRRQRRREARSAKDLEREQRIIEKSRIKEENYVREKQRREAKEQAKLSKEQERRSQKQARQDSKQDSKVETVVEDTSSFDQDAWATWLDEHEQGSIKDYFSIRRKTEEPTLEETADPGVHAQESEYIDVTNIIDPPYDSGLPEDAEPNPGLSTDPVPLEDSEPYDVSTDLRYMEILEKIKAVVSSENSVDGTGSGQDSRDDHVAPDGVSGGSSYSGEGGEVVEGTEKREERLDRGDTLRRRRERREQAAKDRKQARLEKSLLEQERRDVVARERQIMEEQREQAAKAREESRVERDRLAKEREEQVALERQAEREAAAKATHEAKYAAAKAKEEARVAREAAKESAAKEERERQEQAAKAKEEARVAREAAKEAARVEELRLKSDRAEQAAKEREAAAKAKEEARAERARLKAEKKAVARDKKLLKKLERKTIKTTRKQEKLRIKTLRINERRQRAEERKLKRYKAKYKKAERTFSDLEQQARTLTNEINEVEKKSTTLSPAELPSLEDFAKKQQEDLEKFTQAQSATAAEALIAAESSPTVAVADESPVASTRSAELASYEKKLRAERDSAEQLLAETRRQLEVEKRRSAASTSEAGKLRARAAELEEQNKITESLVTGATSKASQRSSEAELRKVRKALAKAEHAERVAQEKEQKNLDSLSAKVKSYDAAIDETARKRSIEAALDRAVAEESKRTEAFLAGQSRDLEGLRQELSLVAERDALMSQLKIVEERMANARTALDQAAREESGRNEMVDGLRESIAEISREISTSRSDTEARLTDLRALEKTLSIQTTQLERSRVTQDIAAREAQLKKYERDMAEQATSRRQARQAEREARVEKARLDREAAAKAKAEARAAREAAKEAAAKEERERQEQAAKERQAEREAQIEKDRIAKEREEIAAKERQAEREARVEKARLDREAAAKAKEEAKFAAQKAKEDAKKAKRSAKEEAKKAKRSAEEDAVPTESPQDELADKPIEARSSIEPAFNQEKTSSIDSAGVSVVSAPDPVYTPSSSVPQAPGDNIAGQGQGLDRITGDAGTVSAAGEGTLLQPDKDTQVTGTSTERYYTKDEYLDPEFTTPEDYIDLLLAPLLPADRHLVQEWLESLDVGVLEKLSPLDVTKASLVLNHRKLVDDEEARNAYTVDLDALSKEIRERPRPEVAFRKTEFLVPENEEEEQEEQGENGEEEAPVVIEKSARQIRKEEKARRKLAKVEKKLADTRDSVAKATAQDSPEEEKVSRRKIRDQEEDTEDYKPSLFGRIKERRIVRAASKETMREVKKQAAEAESSAKKAAKITKGLRKARQQNVIESPKSSRRQRAADARADEVVSTQELVEDKSKEVSEEKVTERNARKLTRINNKKEEKARKKQQVEDRAEAKKLEKIREKEKSQEAAIRIEHEKELIAGQASEARKQVKEVKRLEKERKKAEAKAAQEAAAQEKRDAAAAKEASKRRRKQAAIEAAEKKAQDARDKILNRESDKISKRASRINKSASENELIPIGNAATGYGWDTESGSREAVAYSSDIDPLDFDIPEGLPIRDR